MSEGKKLSISIYDYPEHLNPFNEEDNVGKLHFWSLGRKKRSNSFSLNGFKDFRKTWSFKSFTKKGRRESNASADMTHCSSTNSPVEYRKPLDVYGNNTSSTLNRATIGSPASNQSNRYIYGGSITPLPRFRFQERGSISDSNTINGNVSPSNESRRISSPVGPMSNTLPSKARSESHGSQSSLQSVNPFDTSNGSVRASARKKRRAPPPPPKISPMPEAPSIVVTDTSLNTSCNIKSESTALTDINGTSLREEDKEIDIDHPSLCVELKIIEDVDSTESKNQQQNLEENDTSKKENNEHKVNNADETENNIELDDSKDIQNVTKNKLEKNDQDVKVSETNQEEIKDKSSGKETIPVIIPVEAVVMDSNDERFEEFIYESPKIKKETENDANFVLEKVKSEEPTGDMFPKVNIVVYKKQQSLDQTKLDENTADVPENSNGQVFSNDVNEKPIENDVLEHDNSDISKTNEPSSEIVKCKIIDYHEKTNMIKENARRRSEFFEMDKVNEETESVVVRQKNNDESNNKYTRRTVSDIKLLFDKPNGTELLLNSEPSLNSPNPIPKPRRTRIGSKMSTSSDSFKTDTP